MCIRDSDGPTATGSNGFGEGDGAQDGGYDKRKNYFMNIIAVSYTHLD